MDYRFTILLVLAAGAYAGPTGRRTARATPTAGTTCSTTCTASSKFSYAPGKTYEYKYEVETKTSMLGASEDQSVIGISAIAAVEVHSKCEMILALRDVKVFAYDSRQLQDQDTSGKFSEALQGHPLRFGFQDGTVDSLCPHPDEPAWVLNIKRGILSTFQNTMTNLKNSHSGIESDVGGKCKTEYTVVSDGWRSVSLKKTKQLEDCTHRQGFESAIQTTPYRLPAGLKSLPILHSSHECDQEVDTNQGRLTSTECHELHILRPFSKEASGAATETTQKLTYIHERRGVDNTHVGAGESKALHFEHTFDQDPADLNPKEALDLLRDVCKSTEADIQPDTPTEFSSLVATMKRMDYPGLRRVYNQVNKGYFCKTNGDRVRKFALDAFPMVGTDASVELMKTLISNEDVTGSTVDTWLASLAFIQMPSVKMLQEIAQLSGLPSLSTRVLLPLSALVSSYCQTNPECANIAEVKAILAELERNLQEGCDVNQNNFRTIMMTLRAIGNTGHMESSVPAIYSCLGNKNNPMDIRVAAIQAFRRLSCATDRNNLMEVYRNVEEDSELRIAAYLGVMQCPTAYIIEQVKETLASEQVKQVGSFVWSHLTNLMESSDPANKHVQQLLNDETLDTQFDLEKMKYSRNYEASLFIDSLNSGAKVDSNLLWSTKSFVPRSGYFNLTTHLFGESLNLFEIGGRVEGLDSLLEAYFGPKGYYNSDSKDNNLPQPDPKHARLSGSKFDDIRKQTKTTKDDLRGAVFMRMFGNELSYSMFGANNGIDNEVKSDSDMLAFLKNWRNSQSQDVSLTRNFMFLDSTYTVPTLGGLPLKLAVNGTATVALTAGGQLDLANPASNVLLEGNIQPSGAVRIDSMMSVDAFVTRGGLKMSSTLHTSTGVKAKVQMTDSSILDLSFDLTKDKQEVLDVKNSFFIVYNDEEKEQRMIVKNRVDQTMCSGEKVQEALGLEFCTSFSMPNAAFKEDAPDFPLSGPASASVTVTKKDVPNGYKLEVKNIKTPVQTLFRVLADTPGASDKKRAINLDINVQHKQKTLDVLFASRWKTASLTGELIDSKEVKGITGKLNVDNDARLYRLDARVNVDETQDRVTYSPSVVLEIPDWRNLQLTGNVKYIKEQSLDADLTLDGATETPVSLQGSVMNTDTQVGVSVKFNYEKGESYMFEALSKKDIQKKKLGTKHTYTPRLYVRTPKEELVEASGSVLIMEGKSVKIEGKITKLTKKEISINVDINKNENTRKKRSRYNAVTKIDAGGKSVKFVVMLDDRQGKNYFNRIRFDYNFGKDQRDTLILQNRLKLNMAKTKTVVKLSSNLNSMKNNKLDSALSVSFSNTRFLTVLSADFKYGENHKSKSSKDFILLNMQAKHKLSKASKIVNYTVDFQFPAKSMDLKIKGGHILEDRLLTEDVEITYHPERTVSVNLRLHNKSAKYPNFAGSVAFGLPEGRAMSFAGEFGRESENKYISSVEFEIIKGRRSRIDTMFKLITDKTYEVEVGVKLPDLDPVRVFGGYSKEEKGFKAQAWFKRADNLYSITTDAMLDRMRAGKFLVDVIVPSRRVKLLLDGMCIDTQRHAIMDIQWDADKNLDDRFLVNFTSDYKNEADFELGLTFHYPSRTVTFTMKHASGARYITNVQLAWSPEDKIELDLIFRNDLLDGQKRTELSVMFTSPFKPYEELGLFVSLFRDTSQYQTKSSFTWAKNRKILVSATAGVPMTLSSIDIVGTVITPFKSVKSMTVQINHRYDEELQNFVKFEWGTNRLSVKTNGKAKVTSLGFESFDGGIDIRTPWEGMRIFLLSAEFTNNKQDKITSRLSLDLSRYSTQKKVDKYLIEVDMLYNRLADILTNKGTLQISVPEDDIKTAWEVNLQRSMQYVSLSVNPRRKNNFKIELKNSWEISKIYYKYGTSFQLIIPAESFKELQLTFGFEARDSSYVEASTVILKDTVGVFSHDFKYKMSTGSTELTTGIKCIAIDDVSLKIISTHSLMPYRGNLEFDWAPNQKITAMTNVIYNQFGMYDLNLRVNTPFPRYQTLILSSTRKRMGLNWEATTAFEFAPRQKIVLETHYRYDHVKLGSLSLKTPFPQFPGLETSVNVDGSPINFKGDAAFAMTPYVGKITSNFNWAYYKGTSLSGEFNLNTPYPQWPYTKAKVRSNILGMSRVSAIEVDTPKTQAIKMETDYRFTSLETLEGNVKVTSIYTDNKQVVAGFKHVGNREEFKTTAKITSKYFKRDVFTDATFSSKNGITSTFEMDSPFRGYETVKWNFDHKGTIKDFHTVVEYETNGNRIKLENVFDVKNRVHAESSLVTPFPEMSRAHLKFIHDGQYLNRNASFMAAFNDKLLTADFDILHSDLTSSSNLHVVTPFDPLKKLDVNLFKTGELNDFTIESAVEYGEKWQVTVSNMAKVGNYKGRLQVSTPLQEGVDVVAKYGHVGALDNFETISEISYGPSYKISTKTNFLYALPKVSASHEQTAVIEDNVQKYAFSLRHNQILDERIDISTKATAEINEEKASLEFGFDYMPNYVHTKCFAVLELPVEDFEISKLFIESSRTIYSEGKYTERKTGSLEISNQVIYEEKSETHFDVEKSYYRSNGSVRFGEVIVDHFFEPYVLFYSISSPYEGFESTKLNIKYTGNWQDEIENGNRNVKVTGSLSQSSLTSEITTILDYDIQVKDAETQAASGSLSIDYGEKEPIVFSEQFRPGQYNAKLTTPYQDYAHTEIDLSYDSWTSADLTVTHSLTETPIKATYRNTMDGAGNIDISAAFTSGYTNFTHIKAEVKNTKTVSSVKRSVLLNWEDADRKVKEIEADLGLSYNNPKFKDMTAGFSWLLRTPFPFIEDLKMQFDHQHFMSPMRAKENVFVRFNNKEYLDMEVEVGAVKKFTGSVLFRSPRQMEFTFSGLNEGESVDFDVHLNWNKLERQSQFRLQCGLADDSTLPVIKQVFHIRVTNPNRVVAVHNNFEMKPSEYIKSDGKLSWDEENKKEATYMLQHSQSPTDFSTKATVVVPSRTVEVAGKSTLIDSSLVSTVNVFWDASADKEKMVGLAMSLNLVGQQKAALVELKLPSMNKALSLKSDVTVAETGLDVAGSTEFSYAPEAQKTVHITYTLQRQDPSSVVSVTRAQWNLRHAKTDTDMEMTSVLTQTATRVESVSRVQYTTSNQLVSAVGLTTDLDKEDRLLTVQMTTPDNTALLTGQLTAESPYVMTVDLKHNSKPKFNTQWTVDTVDRSLEATMKYGDHQEQITTRAFFPNETSFESETTSETTAGTRQEGFMTANLKQRLLHAHLKWRPEIFTDVTNFGADCLIELGNEVNAVVQEGTNGFAAEVFDKYSSISSNFLEEMAPLGDSVSEEVRQIQRDLRQMRKTLKKMHQENELYLGTLEEVYSQAVKNMLTGYSVAVQTIGSGYRKMQDTMEELSNQIDTYPLQEKYATFKTSVNNFIEESKAKLEEEIRLILHQISERIQMLSAMYDQAMNDVSVEIQEYFVALVDELTLKPHLDDLKNLYEELLKLQPDGDLKVTRLIKEVKELLKEGLEQSNLPEKYQAIADRAKEILGEEMGNLMQNKDIKDLYELVQGIYKQVTLLYEFADMDTTSLRQLIDKVMAHTRDKLIAEFNQLPIGILDMYKSRFTTFDLEKGEVEFDLYLPIPMENFEQLMRFTVEKYVAKLRALADKYFPRRDICLWDLLYQFPPVEFVLRKDWVPPFDAFATVSGKQHYRTFDGHHFDVAGICSYVLVQDLMDGNFSVVQKYDGGPRTLQRESLVVMVAGKTIEIFRSYLVKVDGKPQELPYETQGIRIVRKGFRIYLTTDIGLDIMSDFHSDFHIFGLSGWYHGRVGGLLGYYDNEPYNDMMLPEGEIETRDQKYLNAWEVDTSCRSKRLYTDDPAKQESPRCAAVFQQSTSSLRPCFLKVAPEEYQSRCDMDPARTCEIASLYHQTCREHGISVSLPDECVKCDGGQASTITAQEPLRFEEGSSQATGSEAMQSSQDVVFVVEERQCNRDMATKLTDIVYQLEQAMTSSGVSDNRYSLVGYEGTEVNSHTMEGQLFNKATMFAKGLENLAFHNLGPYASPQGALSYATSLPFRPGVTKSIILLSCSPCEMSHYGYSQLAAQLQQMDITLHVFREKSFVLKNNKIPKSEIYGIDKKKAYFGSTSPEEANMFPLLVPAPSDYCTDLALQSNGSVFDASHASRGRVRQQKAFLEEFGSKVAAAESECQLCSCEVDDVGMPHTVCRRCDLQPMQPMQTAVRYMVQFKNDLLNTIQTNLY